MYLCERCHSQEDLISIPIELGENTRVITLCKKCILNGFKGVLEELVEVEYHTFSEGISTTTREKILEHIIEGIPTIKKRKI